MLQRVKTLATLITHVILPAELLSVTPPGPINNHGLVYSMAIHDTLFLTSVLASENAFVSALEAIATATGVREISGLPVAQFYQKAKVSQIDALICDFADTNASAATRVKQLWDCVQNE